MWARGIPRVFVFEINEIKRRENQVQRRQGRFPRFGAHHILNQDVFHLLICGIKNRVNRTAATGVELVPAIEFEQPDGGIGLGIKITDQNPVPHLGKTRGNVDEK